MAVDVVLLAPAESSLHTLLVQREEHPFKERWALPGGFIRMNEGHDAAAARVLREKAGLKGIFLEQLCTFGEPFQLLPESFTLCDLQKVHETVLARKLNKDSFRRRMLATGLLEPTGEQQEDVGHRPAALYRYTA